MKFELTGLIEIFARERGVELPPDWTSKLPVADFDDRDESALERISLMAGWREPTEVGGRPKANQFPLMVHSPAHGWAIAEQWEGVETLRINRGTHLERWEYESGLRFVELALPRAVEHDDTPRAINVFLRSMLLRKKVFVSAILATIIINIIALATSLYSMQVYDRVIPRSGFDTLWVLTVGALFALLLDFLLRTTRALMIDREAAKVDSEVSEFFFARAQAIRLDARPQSIGTMASQVRGLEQVRGMMSSATMFILADMPFALFFIVVIFSLAGVLAIVPVILFPLSLILAFVLSKLIRADTARAQVSGNRKNGLLVESFDAAETVKANRGGWFMLARWNDLMEQVHMHEDPVKRWSSIAGSVFGTIQQVAFIAMIAIGAIEVAEGKITMGALLACSILSGRINGPLISQLPGMLVQWGYTKSSLQSLDSILALPLDRSAGANSLRPEKLSGPLRLEGVEFGYPGSRSGVRVPLLEFKPGERVAIIGGIGSGKSTLLKILAGLYGPHKGTAMIGGLDMSQIADEVLRTHIGYISQDSRMVNGTLKQNLLLGLPNPGDDALMAAAQELGLAAMVATHPLGFDLPISEGGRGLSGGQRTLSGVTRLLLAKPQIWLLDEPTANLDQATEARMVRALQAAQTPESIFVMVTHRLQLLSVVDRVLVMANGQIVLDGKPNEVMQKLRAPQPQAQQPAVQGAAAADGKAIGAAPAETTDTTPATGK